MEKTEAMEKLTVKSGQLKNESRCHVKRERKFSTEQPKEAVFYRKALIQFAAIRLYFEAVRLQKFDRPFLEKVFNDCVDGFGAPSSDEERDAMDAMSDIADKGIDDFSDISFGNVYAKALQFRNLSCISDWVKERAEALDYLTEKTAKIQAAIASKQVVRYLLDEDRIPEFCEGGTIEVNGINVIIPFLLVFHNTDGSVEGVKICCCKPDVTQRGKKRDASVDKSLELYAIWKYMQMFYAEKPDQRITASYYFLRRSDDVGNPKDWDSHFFDYEKESTDALGRKIIRKVSGGNVVCLSAPLKDGKEPQDMADNYSILYEQFAEGEDCTENMCAECVRRFICNYNRAPLESSSEKPRQSARDVDLSPAQEKAVNFRKGIARINAGAGAGKTLIVALRTAYMLSDGIDPESMLLITFTNAGADEMRDRIFAYAEDFGIDTADMNLKVTTFNSFGNDIIQKEYQKLGFTNPPRLIDDIERKSIICDLLNRHQIDGLDYRNFDMDMPYSKGALPVTIALFDVIKKDNLSLFDTDALMAKAADLGIARNIEKNTAYGELLKLYDDYDNLLRSRCLIEFQDQERLVFDLLDIDPYYFDALGYHHITIDEYQDTSERQNQLVKKLTETDCFESLVAVGDDSQAIFSFRDATPDNIINFFDCFGEGEDMYLVDNYRCSPEIIEFANKVNERNAHRVEKDLIAKRPSKGIPVHTTAFWSKADNYQWIIDRILEKKKAGVPLGDIEVQAATRAELLEFAGLAADAGIETFVSCPEPMLENSRVIGMIALCRAINDPNATQSILEYQNTLLDGELLNMYDDAGIDDLAAQTSEALREFNLLPEKEKAEKFDERITEMSEGDSIAENFAERLKRFGRVSEKIEYAREFVQFRGENLKRTEKLDGVVLSTAHSSKGLEWPIVFVIETRFMNPKSSVLVDEERRRLLFVAATRARDELYVTGLYEIGRGKEKRPNTMLYQCFTDAGNEKDWNPVPPKKKKRAGRSGKSYGTPAGTASI